MPLSNIDAIFNPKSVTIVGASENPLSFGYFYMHAITSLGFKGDIYPINPKTKEIMGVKTFPSLGEVPGSVDYVVSLISLDNVPDLLSQCASKGVKAVHVMAGRGSETGSSEGKALEEEILKRAKEHGIRIVGPNCLGSYCPGSGVSYHYNFPREPGEVGAFIQSGGNSQSLVLLGNKRGLRFSKVVSYGNAIDLNQNDFLEYLTRDPETKIILAFIEGLRGDGRTFLELLRKATRIKPVVILKGGRSRAGARQVTSHTSSLAGDQNIFETAIRQAGAVPVRNLDELINQAVAFQLLPPIQGVKVGIGGGGGGRCVLSADEWEENGFEVPPLPKEIREYWKGKGSVLWNWIGNPADRSISGPGGDPYEFTEHMIELSKHPDFDFIAANVTEDYPTEKETFLQALKAEVEGYIQIHRASRKPFILIQGFRPYDAAQMDNWEQRALAEMRTRCLEEKLPFFTDVDQAAKAVRELINYYKRKEQI